VKRGKVGGVWGDSERERRSVGGQWKREKRRTVKVRLRFSKKRFRGEPMNTLFKGIKTNPEGGKGLSISPSRGSGRRRKLRLSFGQGKGGRGWGDLLEKGS